MGDFFKENKDLLKEKGFYGWFKIWLKILFYSVGNPLITIFFLYKGWWILAIFWLFPTMIGFAILVSGSTWIIKLSDKWFKLVAWSKRKW